MSSNGAFDPTQHVIKLKGKDYIEVKWRLVWLRERHPDAWILTELVKHTENEAVFRAEVSIPGGGKATGWGTETRQDFGDYTEKAETKALGRALAALGFGTQFCEDWYEGLEPDGRPNVVDAPVQRSAPPKSGPADPGVVSLGSGMSDKQRKMIFALGREKGMSDADLENESRETFGVELSALDKRQASGLIDLLQQRPKVDAVTGEIDPASPVPDLRKRIETAADDAALNKAWSEVVSVGLAGNQELIDAGRKRREALHPAQPELVTAADPERHTRL